MAKAKGPRVAVIKFDPAHHGGQVRGAVNGQRFSFPVDSDVTVTEDQLSALNDSGAVFSVVTPLGGDEGAGEGSSAPSTTLTGTATRLDVADSGAGEGGNPQPVPILNQETDKQAEKSAQAGNTEAAKAAKDASDKKALAAAKSAAAAKEKAESAKA